MYWNNNPDVLLLTLRNLIHKWLKRYLIFVLAQLFEKMKSLLILNPKGKNCYRLPKLCVCIFYIIYISYIFYVYMSSYIYVYIYVHIYDRNIPVSLITKAESMETHIIFLYLNNGD